MDWVYLCIDSYGLFWRGFGVLFRFLCNWNLIDIYKGISYPDKTFRIGNTAYIQLTKIKHRWRNRKIMRKKISLNWWNYFFCVLSLDFCFLWNTNRYQMERLYVWSCNLHFVLKTSPWMPWINTQKYTQRIHFHSWITNCLIIRPVGYFQLFFLFLVFKNYFWRLKFHHTINKVVEWASLCSISMWLRTNSVLYRAL